MSTKVIVWRATDIISGIKILQAVTAVGNIWENDAKSSSDGFRYDFSIHNKVFLL